MPPRKRTAAKAAPAQETPAPAEFDAEIYLSPDPGGIVTDAGGRPVTDAGGRPVTIEGRKAARRRKGEDK